MINWILGALILLAAGLAIRSMVAARKRGGCAGCSGCAAQKGCPFSAKRDK